MSDSRACHPCLKAFEAEALKNTNNNEKIRKVVSTLSWRGRNSTAEVFDFEVKGKTLRIRQVMGGEHQTSEKLDEQPLEKKDLLTGLGTGATCWPASLVLVKFMEKNWTIINQQGNYPDFLTIIELGGGTGILSIAAAMLGAKRVLCTDGSEDVVSLADKNISDHKYLLGNRTIQTCCYRWGEDRETLLEAYRKDVDIILISDCVLPMLFPIAPLVNALDELMGSQTKCYLSYEHRYFAEFHPKQRFISLASAKGLDVHTIPIIKHDKIYSVEDIEIWLVKRRL